MAKFATHNPLAEVYLIQFLFKVDQYTNQEHNHIFLVIQQCCVTHQYFFVSWGKIYIESSFYIHFTRNSIFIMKKIKTVFCLNLVTKYQDYGMETFYFLKMYIGVL